MLSEVIKNIGAVFFVLLYCVVFTIIMSIIINCNEWFLNYYELAESIVNMCVFIVTLLVVLHFKGNMGKFTLKSFMQGLIYSLPVVLFCIYFSLEAIKWIFFDRRDLYTVAVFWIQVFYYITVGIAEEMVFRCAFLNYLLGKCHGSTKKREVFACAYSAFLFGIMHFMGYFTVPDMGLRIALYTVGCACLIGYIFAVLFLKTKNLAVVIFLHFAWNFTTYCNAEMIMEKYKYSGSYNFYHYQVPVLIVMAVIVTGLLYKSRADELSLYPVSESSGEGKCV